MAARASLASLLLLFCIIAHRTSGHKILVYNSKFGHSHSNFLGRIADILAEAGHNVTSLVPIMDASLADGTEKSHVIHVQPDPQIAQFYKNPAAVSRFEMSMFNPIVPFLIGRRLATTFARTCQRVLEEPGLIERLRAEHYDVYITENFDVCGIGFPRSSCPWTQCHSVQGPIGSLNRSSQQGRAFSEAPLLSFSLSSTTVSRVKGLTPDGGRPFRRPFRCLELHRSKCTALSS